MRRPLTLRTRLTGVFAAATATVLLVAGVVLYALGTTAIDAGITGELRDRAAAVRDTARTVALARLPEAAGEPRLQLLSPDGRRATGTAALGTTPILTPAQVRRASQGTTFTTARGARVIAFPVRDGAVVAIAQPLEHADAVRRRLALALFAVLLVTLAVAAYLGHRLGGAALAPVERMRRRATELGDSDLSERLPLPARQDEIARLGEAFNGLLDRLAAAFARERRIVSDASHELRTPLAVLTAELQFGARPDRSPADKQAALESALEETQRLARLAEDLLVLARADEGRLPLRPEPVDAAVALLEAADRANAAARAAGRTIEVHDEPSALVDADPDRLAQALDNLVANALRHGAGTVTLRATVEPGVVGLHVADDGPGFGDALGVAFERFGQGDPARGGGSGLGLAIVDAIARAHGGRARAADRPGGGAEVTVELPRSSDLHGDGRTIGP